MGNHAVSGMIGYSGNNDTIGLHMNIATPETVKNKLIYKSYLDALSQSGGLENAAGSFFAPSAKINVVHPFNTLNGPDEYCERFLTPLRSAFSGFHRRTDILIGGSYKGQEWVSSTGYYVGHMKQDWLGMPASNRLTFIRVGGFHHMIDGKANNSYVFLDLPELMIDLDVWPISRSPGYNGYRPGPATQDGIVLSPSDPDVSQKTIHMVETMLAGLNTPDKDWYDFWDENMLWYGPAAFGAYGGLDQFEGFQVPFEQSFQGWSGGLTPGNTMTRHEMRIGDGNYACLCGWPSLTGVHVKPFLDQEPTKKRIYMRVCDWWRRDGDKLMENWVQVDVPDLLRQLGADPFEGIEV